MHLLESRQVCLSCKHDGLSRTHFARRSHEARALAATKVSHGGLLVDCATARFDGAGEAPHKTARMQAGSIRRIQAAVNIRHPDDLRYFIRVQQSVLLRETETLIGSIRGMERRKLMRAARKAQCPAYAKAGVDRFLIAYIANRLDRRLQREQQFAGHVYAESTGQFACGDRKARGAPAAISARCTVTGDLALDDGDSPLRAGAQQVIGGPKTGVASSEDRNIDIDGTLKRRPRRQSIARVFQPEAVILVALRHPARSHPAANASAIPKPSRRVILSCRRRMLKTIVTTG